MHLSLVIRKPVFKVSDQVRHKPRSYHEVPKFLDARNCCNLTKIQTKRPKLRVLHPKNANGIANSEDPDKTSPLRAV